MDERVAMAISHGSPRFTTNAEPSLDEQRIAVWGVSLGGYCAPRVAGGDERVRACVARAGPFSFADRRPRLTGRAAA